MVFLRNRMLAQVKGTRDNQLKKLLSVATQYYCYRLLPPRIARNLQIEILLKKDLEEDGFCEIADYNTKGKARYFTIELARSLNKKSLLRTLAHECVHIKQYALGELDENMTVWRGRRVNSDTVPYWDHPWEIEAYGKEKGLYVRFSEAHDLGKINYEPTW